MDDHQDQFIQIPIRLEQCILEGSYRQVMDINNKHDKNYQYYLHKFESAIRFQIARSAEKSYESLKLSDAANLLRFTNPEQLISYIKTDIENYEVK
jgi:26S proteasome regulatory subunit N12